MVDSFHARQVEGSSLMHCHGLGVPTALVGHLQGQVPCRFADLLPEIDHVDVCTTNIWQQNAKSER